MCSFPFFLNSQKWVWKPAQIWAKEIHAYCITERKFKWDELLISVFTADDSWATCRTVHVCSIPPLISACLPFLQMEPSLLLSIWDILPMAALSSYLNQRRKGGMTTTAQYSYFPGREHPKIWQVTAWYHYQWNGWKHPPIASLTSTKDLQSKMAQPDFPPAGGQVKSVYFQQAEKLLCYSNYTQLQGFVWPSNWAAEARVQWTHTKKFKEQFLLTIVEIINKKAACLQIKSKAQCEHN